MMPSCMLGVLCGLLLGVRFKVLAILPVQVLAVILLGAAVLHGDMTVGNATLVFLVWGAGLQVGYGTMLLGSAFVGRPMKTRLSKI